MKTLKQLINSVLKRDYSNPRLVINTNAPTSYIPDVLDGVKFYIRTGCDEGEATISGFDETIYTYNFYYKE